MTDEREPNLDDFRGSVLTDIGILRDVASRDITVHHFSNSDGSMTCEAYQHPGADFPDTEVAHYMAVCGGLEGSETAVYRILTPRDCSDLADALEGEAPPPAA